MGNVFYTADLHIGHQRVAGDHRGFDVLDEHDQWLMDNFAKQLRPDDHLWILGDIAMGKDGYALDLVAKLPGIKHLIAGNHDVVHPKNRAAGKHMKRWLEIFETIAPFAERKIAGQKILLSHFPYAADGDGPDRIGEDRYFQWRLPDLGGLLLHGHTHFHGKVNAANNSYHVGVDAHGGQLVPLDVIADWVKGR